MAQIQGAFISMTYDRTDEFSWTDPKDGKTKPIRKFVGLMEAGDGTRGWVDVGFPRDPGYRPPALTPGKLYVMPVVLSVDRKKSAVRLTIRTDMAPFEAPSID